LRRPERHAAQDHLLCGTLFQSHRIRAELQDERNVGIELDVHFLGELTDEQETAAQTLLEHDIGTWVTPRLPPKISTPERLKTETSEFEDHDAGGRGSVLSDHAEVAPKA
jgi:hypothetical protein